MADKARIKDLIVKKLLGELSSEEDQDLEAWADQSARNRHFLEVRMSAAAVREELRAIVSTDTSGVDRRLKQAGDVSELVDWLPEERQPRRLAPYAVAAAILGLIVAGWFISRLAGSSSSASKGYPPVVVQLRWGKDYVDLGEMPEGKTCRAGGLRIGRMGNQFFFYPRADTGAGPGEAEEFYVDVGGKTDVQLFFYDSIRVELSPNSSLRFNLPPAGALLTERRMASDGGLLCFVHPNYHVPFILSTPRQEIKVLGTLFGVRDYKREDTGAVLCYNGSVAVKDGSRNSIQLKASERVTVQPNHVFRVSRGDFPAARFSTDESGFDFSNIRLDSAAKEIAEWYGVPYGFLPGVDTTTPMTIVEGRPSRYLRLEQLLPILSREGLHFSLRGRTLVVGP